MRFAFHDTSTIDRGLGDGRVNRLYANWTTSPLVEYHPCIEGIHIYGAEGVGGLARAPSAARRASVILLMSNLGVSSLPIGASAFGSGRLGRQFRVD